MTSIGPARSRADTPDVDPDSLETDLADLSIGENDLETENDIGSGTITPLNPAREPSSRAGTPAGDDRELEQFRNEWKQDLRAKKDVPSVTSNVQGKAKQDGGQAAEREQNIPRDLGTVKPPRAKESTRLSETGMTSPKAPTHSMPPDMDEEHEEPPAKARSTGPLIPAAKGETPQLQKAEAVDRRDQAVALYSRAVEHEQAGKLNEALMMYRRAFKLDDNVDRLYARSVSKAAQVASTSAQPEGPSSTDIVSAAAPADEPYSFQRHLQLQPDYEKAHPPAHAAGSTVAGSSASAAASSRQSPLTALLSRLPVPADQIPFLSADESLPLPLAKLPLELIDPILAYMDIATIERFAATCWRARYVTSRAPVWRRIVHGIYKAPAILPEGKTVRDLDIMGRYNGEWRTALMEEERVRMDGCYISVCHYIRPGAGDQWVTITHMITYHRFLRFYPDGSVISFLTTDHPSEVVPLLRPSLRGKGLHFGRWRLIRSDTPENTVHPPSDVSDTKGTAKPSAAGAGSGAAKKRARIVISDLLEPGSDIPKYEFEMELALRETGRGRWNKLDILNYQSINLSNGESLALSLKHQKPFYFSKVKSYYPQL